MAFGLALGHGVWAWYVGLLLVIWCFSTVFDLYSVGDGMLSCVHPFTYEFGLIANCGLLE